MPAQAQIQLPVVVAAVTDAQHPGAVPALRAQDSRPLGQCPRRLSDIACAMPAHASVHRHDAGTAQQHIAERALAQMPAQALECVQHGAYTL
jgi:hypothetical protein